MKNLIFIGAMSLCIISCSDDDASSTQSTSAKLVTSSNTTGKITYQDLSSANEMFSTLTVNGLDNDGIYFNSSTKEVILASRTNNRLETYSNLENSLNTNTDNLMLANFSSDMDFTNAREIAVSGDKVIVTQDQAAINGNTNKLFVYQKTSSGFTLLNDYTVDFKLWGIHVEGNDLYAIADLTSDLVYFSNFFSNSSGLISPTKRVTIEGLTRTHGITHSTKDNVMILTDVADAASATDGGIVIINNFSSVFNSTPNMGTIAMMNQIRIYGPNSMLGNPVDVAYDYQSNKIYVAERANGGGKVLCYNMPMVNGDMSPLTSRNEAGVAAVFLIRD